MSRNIQRLGETLSDRMIKTANAAVSIETELGTINENMSLKPDSLQVDIPQGDYMIQAGQKLRPGDRVLIAWCGNEPVIAGPASTEEAPIAIRVSSDGNGNVTIEFDTGSGESGDVTRITEDEIDMVVTFP